MTKQKTSLVSGPLMVLCWLSGATGRGGRGTPVTQADIDFIGWPRIVDYVASYRMGFRQLEVLMEQETLGAELVERPSGSGILITKTDEMREAEAAEAEAAEARRRDRAIEQARQRVAAAEQRERQAAVDLADAQKAVETAKAA